MHTVRDNRGYSNGARERAEKWQTRKKMTKEQKQTHPRQSDSWTIQLNSKSVRVDCILCCSTWEGHLTLLETIFKAIQAVGLTLTSLKVQFGPKEVKYFEVLINRPRTISRWYPNRWWPHQKAIIDLPKPTNIKQLRSVLGMVSFVRKFIPN